ncbi:MAG: aldo/keto reductase [Armatimonadetes bacterium]|nr:aldo/keto reductase [Armatimonadota bacterium]
MERRTLGRTGVELSILGLGGILVAHLPQSEADALVAEAVDRGITYFDVAPTYGDAEERLGPALAPYRSGVFLAGKTTRRDAAGARQELEQSLRRLQTDHLDLYQLHGVAKQEEVAQILGPGGALETFTAARDRGEVRFLGFSAHTEEAALALLDAFPFDSLLFPFNFVTWHQEGLGQSLLARAVEQGIGRLALKAMARAPWAEGAPRPYPKCWYEPLSSPDEAYLALRWALSQPITAAVPPGEVPLFRLALDIAERFTPITPEEAAAVRAWAQTLPPIFRRPQ